MRKKVHKSKKGSKKKASLKNIDFDYNFDYDAPMGEYRGPKNHLEALKYIQMRYPDRSIDFIKFAIENFFSYHMLGMFIRKKLTFVIKQIGTFYVKDKVYDEYLEKRLNHKRIIHNRRMRKYMKKTYKKKNTK